MKHICIFFALFCPLSMAMNEEPPAEEIIKNNSRDLSSDTQEMVEKLIEFKKNQKTDKEYIEFFQISKIKLINFGNFLLLKFGKNNLSQEKEFWEFFTAVLDIFQYIADVSPNLVTVEDFGLLFAVYESIEKDTGVLLFNGNRKDLLPYLKEHAAIRIKGEPIYESILHNFKEQNGDFNWEYYFHISYIENHKNFAPLLFNITYNYLEVLPLKELDERVTSSTKFFDSVKNSGLLEAKTKELKNKLVHFEESSKTTTEFDHYKDFLDTSKAKLTVFNYLLSKAEKTDINHEKGLWQFFIAVLDIFQYIATSTDLVTKEDMDLLIKSYILIEKNTSILSFKGNKKDLLPYLKDHGIRIIQEKQAYQIIDALFKEKKPFNVNNYSILKHIENPADLATMVISTIYYCPTSLQVNFFEELINDAKNSYDTIKNIQLWKNESMDYLQSSIIAIIEDTFKEKNHLAINPTYINLKMGKRLKGKNIATWRKVENWTSDHCKIYLESLNSEEEKARKNNETAKVWQIKTLKDMVSFLDYFIQIVEKKDISQEEQLKPSITPIKQPILLPKKSKENGKKKVQKNKKIKAPNISKKTPPPPLKKPATPKKTSTPQPKQAPSLPIKNPLPTPTKEPKKEIEENNDIVEKENQMPQSKIKNQDDTHGILNKQINRKNNQINHQTKQIDKLNEKIKKLENKLNHISSQQVNQVNKNDLQNELIKKEHEIENLEQENRFLQSQKNKTLDLEEQNKNINDQIWDLKKEYNNVTQKFIDIKKHLKEVNKNLKYQLKGMTKKINYNTFNLQELEEAKNYISYLEQQMDKRDSPMAPEIKSPPPQTQTLEEETTSLKENRN